MPKLLKKKGPKTIEQIRNDISIVYSQMIRNDGLLFFITITKTKSPHAKDLNFCITNNLFNRVWKDYRKSMETLNYLFVIEYPTAISKKDSSLDDLLRCDIHSHIVVNTTLSKSTLEYYLNTCFEFTDIQIQDITKRPDKANLINYFKKQDYLEDCAYNYKVTIPGAFNH